MLDLGLVPALRGLVEDFGRRTRVDAALEIDEPLAPFGPELEVALFRVVQEALTNVARHAAAGRVDVRVGVENGSVRLAVEDDGRGFAGEPTPHLGLLGIRERVTALGGALAIESAPGQGFRLEATIPTGAVA